MSESAKKSPDNRPQQIALPVQPKLAYDPGRFVFHAGVKQVFESLLNLVAGANYPVVTVLGTPRSGKTHLAISIYDKLISDLPAESQQCIELLEGTELVQDGLRLARSISRGDKPIILVDSADSFLSQFIAGNSGALVEIVEHLRASHGHIVFFCSQELESFNFDQHLNSRFKAGIELIIKPPLREDIESLIEALSLQRGMKLGRDKIKYLALRLGNSILDMENYLNLLASNLPILGRKVQYSILDGVFLKL